MFSPGQDPKTTLSRSLISTANVVFNQKPVCFGIKYIFQGHYQFAINAREYSMNESYEVASKSLASGEMTHE